MGVEIEIGGVKYEFKKLKKKDRTKCIHTAGDDKEYLNDLLLLKSIHSPQVSYEQLQELDLATYSRLIIEFMKVNGFTKELIEELKGFTIA